MLPTQFPLCLTLTKPFQRRIPGSVVVIYLINPRFYIDLIVNALYKLVKGNNEV